MKKILLSAVATTLIATSSFAGTLTFPDAIKVSSCHNFNNSEERFFNKYVKYFKGTELQKYSNTIGTAQGLEEAYNNMYGTIEVSFLKNIGLGVSTKRTYKQFAINYIKFVEMMTANNEEYKFLQKYISLVVVNDPRNTNSTMEASLLMNTSSNENYGNVLRESFLIENYIVNKNYKFAAGDEKDRKIKKLIKYIFLGNTEKALSLVNNWHYENVRSYCSSYNVAIY